MFLVEFLEDVSSLKPPVVKGDRALLDEWRFKRFLENNWVCLIERIKIRRTPIIESGERKRIADAKEIISKAEENIKLLHPEKTSPTPTP